MDRSIELGSENVGKLLRKYAIPAIIAMTASSLYNMVDSIFIGQGVGALALSGLAVAFPFQNLAAAFGTLVGIGASTLVSMKLGEKDYRTAQLVLGNVVVLNIVIGFLFTLFSLLFLEPILCFFGASEQTLPYATDYMQIILLGNIITHIYLGLNSMLRASGHPKRAMYATVLTVILNTILDPIFIFVFDWGIQGAAWATVLAQVLALAWQIKSFSKQDELLHFHRTIFKLKKRIVKESLAIGMSPFLMNIAGCFVVILINNGLKTHGGDLAIGAYGIVNRVAFLFLMVVMGLNQGMQPIAGYNYGAKKMDRLIDVFKKTFILGTVITCFGFLCGQLFPGLIARMFTSDAELLSLAKYGMRITFAMFPIIGGQIVISNFFLSIGKSKKSVFISLMRQVIFLIPFLLVFPQFWGLTGIWVSMPAADIAAFVLALLMIKKQFKKWNLTIT